MSTTAYRAFMVYESFLKRVVEATTHAFLSEDVLECDPGCVRCEAEHMLAGTKPAKKEST